MKIIYYKQEDSLCLFLSDKRSAVGDEEGEDDVIYFRDQKTGELLLVEIHNFLHRGEEKINIHTK